MRLVVCYDQKAIERGDRCQVLWGKAVLWGDYLSKAGPMRLTDVAWPARYRCVPHISALRIFRKAGLRTFAACATTVPKCMKAAIQSSLLAYKAIYTLRTEGA